MVWVVAVAAVSLYTRSRVCTVTRSGATSVRHLSVAAGTLGAWSIDVVTRSAGVEAGKLVLRRSLDQSFQDHQPTADEVSAFGKDGGWRYEQTPLVNRPPTPPVEAHFSSFGDWRFAGAGVYPSTGGAGSHWTIEAPLWLLTALPVPVLLVLGLRSRRRRRRIERALCPHCAHDVSKAMLVCPGCGKDLVKR